MARSIGMALENPTPVYRAVILYLYPGVHDLPLKTYTTANGGQFHYHKASAYGPYGTRAPASSQITSAINYHNDTIQRGGYTNTAYKRQGQPISIPEVTAFVEDQTPSWNPIRSTCREA